MSAPPPAPGSHGPDHTLLQVGEWLTANASIFDGLFDEVPRLQAVTIAEELTEQHPEEEHEMTTPRARFTYLFEGGRKRYCDLSDMMNGAALRLFRAVQENGGGIRSRCVVNSELFHYESWQLTVHADGNCEGHIRHWDFDGAGPEYTERLEQIFKWSRDGRRYAGYGIELRLGGPHIKRFVSQDDSSRQALLQNPVSIYGHPEVTPYRDEAFQALFRMKWRPTRVEMRADRLAVLFDARKPEPIETTGSAPLKAGRHEVSKPHVGRQSSATDSQNAWIFHRSTLDRYCPKFEPEYPPGIEYRTSALLHAGYGRAVDAATLPVRMRQISSHKQLPDYLLLTAKPVISRAFREIIEGLEPHIHQFFPIVIVGKDGTTIDDSYCILNDIQNFDAVILEQSSITWFTRPDGTTVPTGPETKFVLDRQVIAGRHMWRNSPSFTQHRFVSNVLKEAIDAARLKQLQFTQIRVAERI